MTLQRNPKVRGIKTKIKKMGLQTTLQHTLQNTLQTTLQQKIKTYNNTINYLSNPRFCNLIFRHFFLLISPAIICKVTPKRSTFYRFVR